MVFPQGARHQALTRECELSAVAGMQRVCPSRSSSSESPASLICLLLWLTTGFLQPLLPLHNSHSTVSKSSLQSAGSTDLPLPLSQTPSPIIPFLDHYSPNPIWGLLCSRKTLASIVPSVSILQLFRSCLPCFLLRKAFTQLLCNSLCKSRFIMWACFNSFKAVVPISTSYSP